MDKKVLAAIDGRSLEKLSSSKHNRYSQPIRIVPQELSTDQARRDEAQRARFAQDMGVPGSSLDSTTSAKSLQVTIYDSGTVKPKAATPKVLPEKATELKPSMEDDVWFKRQQLPGRSIDTMVKTGVNNPFQTPDPAQRRLNFGNKSAHSNQDYKESFQSPFWKERIPDVVQAEMDVNDEACAPSGYAAV